MSARNSKSISLHHGEIIDISALKERHEIVDDLPLDELALVKTPADLRKDHLSRRKDPGVSVRLAGCSGNSTIFTTAISPSRDQCCGGLCPEEVKRILEEHPGIFQVEGLRGTAGGILSPAFPIPAGSWNRDSSALCWVNCSRSSRNTAPPITMPTRTYVGDATTWQRITDFTQGDDLYAAYKCSSMLPW
jgi:hypothetical protein